MSLNWNREKVKDWKKLVLDDKGEVIPEGSAVCDTLIWGSISLGYNSITEKNFVEIAARFSIYEGAFGAFIHKPRTEEEHKAGKPIQYRPITLDDVMNWIGLHTNASPLTKTQFMKRVYDRKMEEYNRTWKEKGVQ